MQLDDTFIQTVIKRARVARFSTIDHENIPHTVPVVFVFDGECYYIPLDNKRKTQPVEKLKRVRNIQNNPNVALLIDEYNEDWSKLVFIMIQGKACLIGKEERGNGNNDDDKDKDKDKDKNYSLKEIHALLYQKYFQYNEVGIGQYCIKIKPHNRVTWKNE